MPLGSFFSNLTKVFDEEGYRLDKRRLFSFNQGDLKLGLYEQQFELLKKKPNGGLFTENGACLPFSFLFCKYVSENSNAIDDFKSFESWLKDIKFIFDYLYAWMSVQSHALNDFERFNDMSLWSKYEKTKEYIDKQITQFIDSGSNEHEKNRLLQEIKAQYDEQKYLENATKNSINYFNTMKDKFKWLNHSYIEDRFSSTDYRIMYSRLQTRAVLAMMALSSTKFKYSYSCMNFNNFETMFERIIEFELDLLNEYSDKIFCMACFISIIGKGTGHSMCFVMRKVKNSFNLYFFDSNSGLYVFPRKPGKNFNNFKKFYEFYITNYSYLQLYNYFSTDVFHLDV